jgi:hypothetical protein
MLNFRILLYVTIIKIFLLNITPLHAVNSVIDKYKTGTQFIYPISFEASLSTLSTFMPNAILEASEKEDIIGHFRSGELNIQMTYTNLGVVKWLDTYPRVGLIFKYPIPGFKKRLEYKQYKTLGLSTTISTAYNYLDKFIISPTIGIGIVNLYTNDKSQNDEKNNLGSYINNPPLYLEMLMRLNIEKQIVKNWSSILSVTSSSLYSTNRDIKDKGNIWQLNLGLKYTLNPYIIDYKKYLRKDNKKTILSAGILSGYRKISPLFKNEIEEEDKSFLTEKYKVLGIYGKARWKFGNFAPTLSVQIYKDDSVKKIIEISEMVYKYRANISTSLGLELIYNIFSLGAQVEILLSPISLPYLDAILSNVYTNLYVNTFIFKHIELGVNFNYNLFSLLAGEKEKLNGVTINLGYVR